MINTDYFKQAGAINERSNQMQSGYYAIRNGNGETVVIMRRFVNGNDVLEVREERILSVHIEESSVFVKLTNQHFDNCVTHKIDCGSHEAALECMNSRHLS